MSTPEPWLRGTLIDVPAVPRAVLHALELARQDLQHWCGSLTDEQLNARPVELPSVAFHVRHISRSLDRLLTYAEGNLLSTAQMEGLTTELYEHSTAAALFTELESALISAAIRIRAIDGARLEELDGSDCPQLWADC